MFFVLREVYTKAREKTPQGQDVYELSWKCIGDAFSMEDAKRKYGGHPVLEAV